MSAIRLLSTLAGLLAVPLALAFAGAPRQHQPDPTFNAAVARPAYTTAHPIVLFDEVHRNGHTAAGTYKPFVDLITNDGYKVLINTRPLTRQSLERCAILVIASPRGRTGRTAAPAIPDAESDAIQAWVQAGGALLLIADHPPYGAAAATLAGRFKIDVSPGYAIDKTSDNIEGDEQSELVFSRSNGLLADHPITEGRGAAEEINRVILFSGTSLGAPDGQTLFLKLSGTAWDVLPPEPTPEPAKPDDGPADHRQVSAAGRGQGVALEWGKGRVVVFGEAAALTAQIGSRELRYGMNYPGTDNKQLALNIMHWLSRLLN